MCPLCNLNERIYPFRGSYNNSSTTICRREENPPKYRKAISDGKDFFD
jgi:hypothetical protein